MFPGHTCLSEFQSTRLSRASTLPQIQGSRHQPISIHKALASLDSGWYVENRILKDFNPQGSREPRPIQAAKKIAENRISIHKALASLDGKTTWFSSFLVNFNPQGSREPRRQEGKTYHSGRGFQSTRLSRASTKAGYAVSITKGFQSTRLSRASTIAYTTGKNKENDFNPQGSREPRRTLKDFKSTKHISIHKALASLDGGNYWDTAKDRISIHKALASLD